MLLAPTVPNSVKINGQLYILATLNGKPVYTSGTRIIQQIPTDDFEITWRDFSAGIGTHYHYSTLLATRRGRLSLPPAATTFTLPAAIVDRWWDSFEEPDANGRWYKYFVSPQGIIKLDITSNPPVLRQCYALAQRAAFNSNDRFGTPWRDVTSGTTYWYFPCNNGDRMVRLTTPVGIETTNAAYSPVVTLNGDITAAATSLVYTSTGDPISAGDVIQIDSELLYVGAVNTGTNTCSSLTRAFSGTTAATHTSTTAITLQGGGDVFAAVTSVVKGAAFSRQLPSGRTARATSSHSAGTAQNQAEISLKTSGAAPETDANWGDDFDVDNQTRWILSLLNFDDYIIVCKQDGWFIATIQPDNTLSWRTLLPDAEFGPAAAWNAQTFGHGAIWHGRIWLPTDTRFWRHTLAAAKPHDPDSIFGNEYEGYDSADILYGNVSAVVPAGDWMYLGYRQSGGSTSLLLAARERQPEDPGTHPLVIHSLASVSGVIIGGSLQRNGAGTPRLFYSYGATAGLGYISLAADRSPYLPAGSYGAVSTNYDIYLNEIIFPCNVLLREFRLVLDNANAQVTWSLWQFLDGARSGTGTQVGSGRTTTGSLFWTAGTNDEAQGVALRLQAACSGSYTPSGNTTAVRRCTLYGHYLPDVSEDIVCTIDLPATAQLRGMSIGGVQTEIEALVRTGSYSWTDILGNTGNVLVLEKRREPYVQIAALVSDQYAHLKLNLLEYT